MFQRWMYACLLMVLLAAVPSFAADDCKKGTFVGSYTRQSLNFDVFGDGSVIHNFLFQLTLNADGSARESWTGTPDYLLTLGTGSTSIGSWTCRSDGKLVVNLISGSYAPAPGIGINGDPITDVSLVAHSRSTYLITITDANTLTRTQSRIRSYDPSQDPTDPNVGTLGPIRTNTVTYRRLIATDTDLNLP